jgi:hypothetical protein
MDPDTKVKMKVDRIEFLRNFYMGSAGLCFVPVTQILFSKETLHLGLPLPALLATGASWSFFILATNYDKHIEKITYSKIGEEDSNIQQLLDKKSLYNSKTGILLLWGIFLAIIAFLLEIQPIKTPFTPISCFSDFGHYVILFILLIIPILIYCCAPDVREVAVSPEKIKLGPRAESEW